MKTKILSVILSLASLLCLFNLSAVAEAPEMLIMYVDIDDNTAEVSRYLGFNPAGEAVEIPAKTDDGKTVVGIGESAFYGSFVTSVVIPETVSYIDDYAFCMSEMLSSVVIPNSVKEIGEYAFKDCVSLKSVTIGAGVTNIGAEAFKGCAALEKVTFGKSVATIGDSAFDSCTALKNITLPDSVVSVGNRAFADCPNVKTLKIGKKLKKFGEYAFCDTLHLEYYGNPTEAEIESLYKKNITADKISIHIGNTAAQKYIKRAKKDFTCYHVDVAKKAKPTISASLKPGKIAVKFSKVKTAKKYELVLSGKAKRRITVSKTSYTIRRLKAGRYTVRVRAKFGKKFGKYSKILKVRVKAA
jgi:hypothetical protein